MNEERRSATEPKVEISHPDDDLGNLMSSTEIGTIFVDRGLRVKLFTPRVRDLFDLLPADTGRPLLDIPSKLADTGLRADLERVLDRLQTVEREVQTRDGQWYLMRLLPYRTAEDRIDGVVLTFVDPTERKRADGELRQSREALERTVAARTAELRETSAMLQSLINASPLAIISVDRERNVRSWNAAAEAMFGWRAEEIVGHPLPTIPDEFAGEVHAQIAGIFDGEAPAPHDSRRRRRDGTLVDVNVLGAPIRDSDGVVHASMAMIQDISERKALEREREELLRRIVGSQEEERQRIARELHDQLGQHLTALKVGLEALRASEGDAQRLTNLVSEIDRSVDRLTRELRPPVLDDVGLHGAISSLIEEFTSASGIRADMHATGTGGERLPEPVETTLYRVLQEALTNVWRHSRARNVSVIVERTAVQVQLIVEDDGIGFGQAAADRSRFGLLGMRERISLIGGSFNIEAAPGQGTTLYVRVPLKR